MDQAKDACFKFIEDTNFEFVEIGLIQFGMGSGASVLHGLSRDAKSLRNKVDSLVATGGTPMHEALSLGVAMLGGKDKNIEKFIVLFTDGYPDDRARTTNSSTGAKRLGIQVMCIGVGTADQELLDEMATTPGHVEFSKSSEELVTSFGNIARLISGRRV
ncbi:MAG: VWA domain-containing protein [Candidatus Solibacter sp.]|nr:VWA domain-containing protein [Candidatus Solibacter sp.]